jgi:hypothetical protein
MSLCRFGGKQYWDDYASMLKRSRSKKASDLANLSIVIIVINLS